MLPVGRAESQSDSDVHPPTASMVLTQEKTLLVYNPATNWIQFSRTVERQEALAAIVRALAPSPPK